jgi:RimJ/RimL family protein N-acetyltransferase
LPRFRRLPDWPCRDQLAFGRDGAHGADALRDWEEGDLPLLQASMGDPAMTRYLGGPESPDKIAARHLRYVALAGTGTGHMFVILLGTDQERVGSVGFWDRELDGEAIYEIGWSVLPAHQGRGLASRATALALERARSEGRHRYVHAFPSVENAASNGICRRVGFTLLGDREFEYPPGHLMHCNDWRFDLLAATLSST